MARACLDSANLCAQMESWALEAERVPVVNKGQSDPVKREILLAQLRAHVRAEGDFEYEKALRDLRALDFARSGVPNSEETEIRSPLRTNSPATKLATPRAAGTVTSTIAVERMDAYRLEKGLGLTEFATLAGTTDRTLRSFRSSGKARRDIVKGIAKAMGLSLEDLIRLD